MKVLRSDLTMSMPPDTSMSSLGPVIISTFSRTMSTPMLFTPPFEVIEISSREGSMVSYLFKVGEGVALAPTE